MKDNLHNQPLTPSPVPQYMGPLRVALVGCGKDKLAYPAPARHLYVGNLFKATVRFVEASGYDAWYVLSARFGLLFPYAVVGPYEATMDTKTVDDLIGWVNKVDAAFRCSNPGYGQWTTNGGRLTVDIFAGAAYAHPLATYWDGLGWKVRQPLAGLQIGERLAWLKINTSKGGGDA